MVRHIWDMLRTQDHLRQLLLARSAVNVATAVVEGVHCREWQRAQRGGYGRLWDGERLGDAHRLAHEVWIGPILAGLDVLHRCDNPGCIEPKHLWSGTQADNNADRDAKGRNGGWKNRGRSQPSTSRGERHTLSKLTTAQVIEIKARLKKKHPGRKYLNGPSAVAREYGVSEGLIRGIEAGRNWSWL